MINLLWIIFTSASAIRGSSSLNTVEVVVPSFLARGDTALLQCLYDLEREPLYSVKWYKDNEEFYRFMPKQTPLQQSYKVEGVKVEQNLSDDKKVMLKAVTLKSTGFYKCEVSAEAPGFSSDSGEGFMEIIYLPKDGPFISGQDKEYQVGDVLNLNCTSGKSYPVSALHWYVNDEKITNPKELVDLGITKHHHGLESASLGLRMRVTSHHVRTGPEGLRARCVATAPGAAASAGPGRAVPLTDSREAMMLVRSGTSRNLQSSIFQLFGIFWIFLTFIHTRDENSLFFSAFIYT